MAKKNKPKKINLEDLGGFVFSTNPEFNYDRSEDKELIDAEDQLLELHFEKKGRGGKQVVIIKGFQGTNKELLELSKRLKQTCGVGGSAKNSEIILQGNVRDKARNFLEKEGFKTKRVGG
ncbi:MAG: translation initiation factor [Flavobacteriales bacterium]|nr:translation initiation factor [Flavobacteriales bacterium]|tara:strand:- start:1621 stop:1980 length:360 start_codon:yes stop_codon:yes gene_type:complete